MTNLTGRASTGRECYEDYCAATGGKSAVTGDTLPDFDACPPAVKAGWEAVAKGAALRADRAKP